MTGGVEADPRYWYLQLEMLFDVLGVPTSLVPNNIGIKSLYYNIYNLINQPYRSIINQTTKPQYDQQLQVVFPRWPTERIAPTLASAPTMIHFEGHDGVIAKGCSIIVDTSIIVYRRW